MARNWLLVGEIWGYQVFRSKTLGPAFCYDTTNESIDDKRTGVYLIVQYFQEQGYTMDQAKVKLQGMARFEEVIRYQDNRIYVYNGVGWQST